MDWLKAMEALAGSAYREGIIWGKAELLKHGEIIKTLAELVDLERYRAKHGEDSVYQTAKQRIWKQAFKVVGCPENPQ